MNLDQNKSENKSDTYLKTCVEGILFVYEGIVKPVQITSVLGITEKKLNEIIKLLELQYINENRGFIIRRVSGGFKMYSNPSISEVLTNFVKSNIRSYLSQAALETLSIICYKQPVTRTQIAEIRGVRTDSVILTLLGKGLIREAGRLKEPGNPIIYKVTDRFLEIIGIQSVGDLPPLKDFD
jgi:segregation and condensation protein B